MRINRIDTKAYVISADAEEAALKEFKQVAKEIENNSKSQVKTEISHHYTPLMVVSAIKYDKEGRGLQIEGLENTFHIGLRDACFYVFHKLGISDAAKDAIIRTHGLNIQTIDFLLQLASLSPKALKTLGWLLDNGTSYFDNLDVPTQQAVKELNGRKFADVWRGPDRESEITAALREIVEIQPVTPLTKVRALVPTPRFTDPVYNLSNKLKLTEYVEDEIELEKIVHAPDKINYILGTFFNSRLNFNKIVYMPYIQCSFQWAGKQKTEIRYIPCTKNATPIEYKNPKRLKTITIGTKGYGLEAIPFEDVAINFSNVAGMNAVKEKLKEGIIYPIAHPELSKQYGSKGGGGVLLYGPPGCGKSYIMRATVGEAGVNFFSVSIQDIIGDDIESASKRIDEIFGEARESSPSIIFFDEIDALGGQRKSGQSGSEHRLVNQFLQNMDGVGASNENVLVVGSTNAPWDMDPALRRAGRFTMQILIPPPDEDARLGLFKAHTKGRPLSEDMDFKKLVQLTENRSSADITAVCDEAAKIPWRDSIHGVSQRQIKMDDFITTLNETESSLIPWLRLAEKQLRDSGEADVFPELADYVFKRAGGIEMITQPKMTFADVGGLDEVKEEIKNKIVYPLAHPELAKQYGKTVGGGMLFYGPPGCGKTYIAQATAGECKASFFNVKMTDLLSPEEGVTEKRLHSIFERASRNTPAIIFFDEIDAVAGQRSSSGGGTERRLINQFLVEMDGFEKKEGVMVIGATNAPWDIDPALRRAGRFSDQIFLPPPDTKSRLQILKIHLKNRPTAENINLQKIAEETEEYSSADLKLITDEAAKIPWKESLATGQKRPINTEDMEKVLTERKPSIGPWLKQAEKQLKGSGESEVYKTLAEYVFKRSGGLDAVTAPSTNFSNVAGLEEVKEQIKEKIVYPLAHPELAKQYGKTVGGGMLFYGPPGCGKTYIAQATAGECKASFFNVKMTDLLSPEEGVTEKRLHSIFERASRNTPAIIFFDEIDAVAGQRSSSGGGTERRLINQFLVEMDGFEKKEGVMVIGATNAPWDIDPALRRAGRFSDQIFLPPPDTKSRLQILKIHLKNRPTAENINLQKIAEETEYYSSADLTLICEEAAKIPWKESLATGQKRPINTEDMEKAASERKSTLMPWFQQAQRELGKSEQQEVYPELAKTIAQFFMTGNTASVKDPEFEALSDEKQQLELMLKSVKEKYSSGDIDESTLKELAKDYAKRLIEVEAKISFKQRKKGE